MVRESLTGKWCSPRTRGWSHTGGGSLGLAQVLPAGAGMVPIRPPRSSAGIYAPRPRGDGPVAVPLAQGFVICSPPARGSRRPPKKRPTGQPRPPAPKR
ncbi:hypothetical protein FQU76_01295 [Streptomyces qinzhouensis]|uniref:Uncharacterized protein n=1 Tax=Streptomyces qinzhouensis TaxID=2599401 RepID=A0A5B8IE18_9ACTN|nr:hypothetical protein FQU76_01295 [Streptomyces qinzhouensis]